MVVKTEEKTVQIKETVTLSFNGNTLSDVVINKFETHRDSEISNIYCFDCSKTDLPLFEKAIISGNLTVNNIIAATVLNVDVKLLTGVKTITVTFLSGL
jgi:hypothetical protein